MRLRRVRRKLWTGSEAPACVLLHDFSLAIIVD